MGPSRSTDKDEFLAARTGLSKMTCCSIGSAHQIEQLFRKLDQGKACCLNELKRSTLI